MRSAASSRMDEHVLAAAPHALCVSWAPAVDREMVLLQAQLAHYEAEAAISALRRQRADISPPTRPSPPEVDGEGVRQPPATTEQLQELVVQVRARCTWGRGEVLGVCARGSRREAVWRMSTIHFHGVPYHNCSALRLVLAPSYFLVDLRRRRRRPVPVQASVRSMRGAMSVNEPWLALNNAVQLYNAALPLMQQHRYADL